MAKKHIPWNKGLTKHDHPSLMRVATKRSQWWKDGPREETRKRIGLASKGRIRGGAEHPAWGGGRLNLRGYIYIHKPNHPHATKKRYVLEHRLVMEKKIGRYLTPDEDVHHINGVKDDNRVENLRLVSHKNHFDEIFCPHCGGTITVK